MYHFDVLLVFSVQRPKFFEYKFTPSVCIFLCVRKCVNHPLLFRVFISNVHSPVRPRVSCVTLQTKMKYT